MWCRLQGVRKDGRLEAVLLNAPVRTDGVSARDRIAVDGVVSDGTFFLRWARGAASPVDDEG